MLQFPKILLMVSLLSLSMRSTSVFASTKMLDLSQVITIGATESTTLAQIKKSGIRFERITIDMPQGYSKALTAGPGLLAILNGHGLAHSLLMPELKPVFIVLHQHSRIGVVAIVSGQVHSYLIAISDADVKPTKNPFEYARLKTFHQKLGYLKSLCKWVKPTEPIGDGQGYAWSGSNCSNGGRLQIAHKPGQQYPLMMLAHP